VGVLEDDDDVGRVGEVRLVPVGAEGSQRGEPLLAQPSLVGAPLLRLRGVPDALLDVGVADDDERPRLLVGAARRAGGRHHRVLDQLERDRFGRERPHRPPSRHRRPEGAGTLEHHGLVEALERQGNRPVLVAHVASLEGAPTLASVSQAALFRNVADVRNRLAAAGYLADDAIATVVLLADRLGRPVLVEGPAGVGKTELAKAVAAATGSELVRLQCYEGLDEARALYEWNYRKQLLRIQSGAADALWAETHDEIFSEEFLLPRPLLTAIRRADPTVLLIDETDKADVEVEGLLLEVLSDFQVTIPELGTVSATRRPFVVLTSNATRELSEALRRRCLFLHLDYPDHDREKAIVLSRVPELPEVLAEQLVRIVRTLRSLELRKPPSVAESVDWARTLVALGVGSLDEATVRATLGVVLKTVQDQSRAVRDLKLD
jgi:MoxR-like ATPase